MPYVSPIQNALVSKLSAHHSTTVIVTKDGKMGKDGKGGKDGENGVVKSVLATLGQLATVAGGAGGLPTSLSC